MNSVNKTQVDKLGDRIRQAAVISEEDLELLQDVRAAHDDAMREVADRLVAELALQPASRLKTVGTIVDKLRRERMRLSQMQDIAGVRVVADVDRMEQDALTERIVALFPGSKVVDRRVTPSYGYRAVHVVAPVGGRLVEIQVRTELQHLWAQAMERVADTVGRGLRYGEGMDGGVHEDITKIVRAFVFMADLIDFSEGEQVAVRLLGERAEQFFGTGQEPPLFRSIRGNAAKTEQQLREACRGLLDTLTVGQSES